MTSPHSAGEPMAEIVQEREGRSTNGSSEPRRLLLDRVAQRPLPDVIAEQILEGIQRDGLARGDRLPTEQQFTRQLGVGRTSIREALQQLHALGIVEVRKGRGTFVADRAGNGVRLAFSRCIANHAFTSEEFIDVGIALEAQAASLAAIRADEDQIAELDGINSEREDADIRQVTHSDERFHLAIFEMSRSRMLAMLYRGLLADLLDFRRDTLALPWGRSCMAREHVRIVAAIRNRDPEAARAAMVDHLWVLHEGASEVDRARGAVG
jgi:GntR family transcriptional regulator, transcriptional repressor for pyruvate dehydrogenase complex